MEKILPYTQQVEKEVKIHSNLAHQNIVSLRDYVVVGGCAYLVMEFAACGELFERIGTDLEVSPSSSSSSSRNLLGSPAISSSRSGG